MKDPSQSLPSSRALTQYDINDLIIKKLFENIDTNETEIRCPRCKSLKVTPQEKGIKNVHHRELLTSKYFEGKPLDYIFFNVSSNESIFPDIVTILKSVVEGI